MNGLVDLMMGQGSEGGLLELLFNGNGPIGSLIYNAAKLSSGEVGSGNHGLRANLSVGKGQRNNKVGNGVVNNL
ncbi:hypothetical protein K502DRAFT_323852 [Neoconidiobolus thromboides FSU 785]|nr:hypothetical protein K502DRAFT_323852 [Neoconidiobolus thromboides FSU 785]